MWSIGAIDTLVPTLTAALTVGTADLTGIGIGVDTDLVCLVKNHVADVGRTGHFNVHIRYRINR